MNAMTNQVSTSALAAAWVKAFAAIEGAVKNASNPHYKSKFADLPSVIAAIKPHLVANGLAYFQISHPNDNGIDIETVLIHESGEEKSIGRLFVPAAKKDPQGFGSAQTYCRRFCLQTSFGLPAYDDDGELASRQTESEPHPILVDLRAAAMEGKEELRAAFEKHKEHKDFNAIWSQHSTSLKSRADASDEGQP